MMDNTNKQQLQNSGAEGENEKSLSIRDLIFMVLTTGGGLSSRWWFAW
jgi:hypothetical protein